MPSDLRLISTGRKETDAKKKTIKSTQDWCYVKNDPNSVVIHAGNV